ncbi:hypothetical protein SNE40_011501 [Patella caerulea]|uniref:Uncharacterized protein n=1 Tax=Patella caerulea TaxID=87958 RepID=A0AAN8PXX1_PATCE
MTSNTPVFVFMDTLPTVSECISCIISYAPTYGSRQQQEAAWAFSYQIEELWHKSFSKENVIVFSSIKRKLDVYLKDYRSQVQKVHRTKKRNSLKNWKEKHSFLFDLLKPNSNPDSFDSDEKSFYYDQKTVTRKMALSDQVDENYELQIQKQTIEHSLSHNVISSDDDDNETGCQTSSNLDETMLIQCKMRSGKVRLTKCFSEVATQTEPVNATTPIRKVRNCVPDVKIAIASTSSKAGITVEQSRRAFQATCEVFTKDRYYLSVDDVPKVCSEANTPTNRKRPKSKEDYEKYKFVLPSARVINREKHLQAIQAERNCALAMMDADPEDVIAIHYDTTKRRRIQGDWTSLIVKINNGECFRLRPLSLAIENRETITELLVEEFKRLAKAGEFSANILWEKVTSLMTESVSKNLHIEASIAATLNSTHIPFHLLCVSHTCEVFDRGNLCVLREAEDKLDLRNILIARMPSLKSFLTNKSVTLTALEALSKLVANDGHLSSQWELFDKILAEKNRTKKHSIYKERRFAKLGYTASTILYHLSDYEQLLIQTKSNNQLVQACRVYLECEFIVIGLKVLSWFTYKVTLPFLNMVELCSQKDLLNILPKLYDDLSTNSLDTLCNYQVNYSFEVSEPLSAIEKHILSLCSNKAAADLATQRGREYGFGPESDASSRATALHKLEPSLLEFLPTDNLDCERDLAKFDKLAQRSAACSNKRFTGRSIRDEMTVYKSPPVNVEKITKSMSKILDKQEQQWMEKQKLLNIEKLKKDCNAALKATEYIHILLKKCKTWGGPITDVNELEKIIQNADDKQSLKSILKSEISYRKQTSNDTKTRPHLYKLNQLSTAEMKINLTLMLTTETDMADINIPDMPTEDDMSLIFFGVNKINKQSPEREQISEPEVTINEPCVVIWDNGRQWYVGICISEDTDGTYTVEHLERCISNESKLWRHPLHTDIQTVDVIQILPCNIIGSWDLRKRAMTFDLENWEMIDVLFRSFY